jgi:predicted metal-dependent hydrolase
LILTFHCRETFIVSWTRYSNKTETETARSVSSLQFQSEFFCN